MQTKNGKIWLQNNEKDKSLTLKYKEKNFDKTFNNFIEFMIFEVSKTRNQQNNQDEDEENNQLESKNSKLNDKKL